MSDVLGAHQGHLASIDRLFESVIASLVQTGRDEYSRRLHLFETLDLLENAAPPPISAVMCGLVWVSPYGGLEERLLN